MTARQAVPPRQITGNDNAGSPLDVLPIDQFEALIQRGRLQGGLTQDEVMTVLRSVELSADLITGVVERIRAAGIEFTYDTGETTIVPMSVAVADEVSGHLRECYPAGQGEEPATLDVLVVPEQGGVSTHANGHAPAATAETLVVPSRAPKKPRAPRSTASDGFGEGDSFRGSTADPVHMYLKEIGKVKLLDASLEVGLAERILAGNEA